MLSFPFFAGSIASMIHVISGPDHLAAVTPIAIETESKAWRVGLFWGLGHLLGMLLIGVLFLAFKAYIPVESISAVSEQLVAFMLIGVGVWSFYQIYNRKKNSRSHAKAIHTNPSTLSSIGIGVLHGFAGVAHFIFLLPVLGFETQFQSAQYLIGFAIGTVMAMTAYTFVLEKITVGTRRFNNANLITGVRLAGGLFAIVIGFYWLYLNL